MILILLFSYIQLIKREKKLNIFEKTIYYINIKK